MDRRLTIVLSMLAVATAVALLASTEKIRSGVRAGFDNTISGADLVVGTRTGSLNLLLYSVFRLGDPLQSVSWETFERVAQHPDVAWAIPLSLGDSHRGYRVLGTDDTYLAHYRYGSDVPLKIANGQWMSTPSDAVLGAEVARALNYNVGTEIILSHGIVSAGFADHDDAPFRVVGILAPTGTPVDRTVHVTLSGLDAIHGGDTDEGATPQAITSFLVGMENRPVALQFQRVLNTYQGEPLTAAIPGAALSQLWSVIRPVETILRLFTALVFAIGMVGLSTTLLASLAGRRRELAILRALGARPSDLMFILTAETVLTSVGGFIIGWCTAYFGLLVFGPTLQENYGLVLSVTGPNSFDGLVFLAVLASSFLLGLVPGIAAYRSSLNDGLSPG
ncbi:MAG: ABC transporter permease [Pseudomonadota bacterium]